MSTPDQDVVSFLNTNVASLTTGTNLFYGPVRPPDNYVPSEAVFCLKTGGFPPEAVLGKSLENHIKSVQIRVRGDKMDYSSGQTLADSIRDAFLGATNVTGYFDTRLMQTEPNYLGVDQDGHHEWSINVQLWVKE